MKNSSVSRLGGTRSETKVTTLSLRFSIVSLFLCIFILLLSACGTANQPNTAPLAQKVNVFGSAANHVHAMLAMGDHVLVVGTHYGLFRSADSGKSWSGPNVSLNDMMTSSLASSSLNQQRLYVLAEHSLSSQTGVIGLYSSSDQGATWHLMSSAADTGKMYTVVAGNRSADEVYAYVPTKGANGLLISKDGGQHFTSSGTLPFGRILGLLALPNKPGELLVYSNDGAARSSDGGVHWDVIKSFDSSVYNMSTGGPNSPIYAASDAGIYASQDDGKHFEQVYASGHYSALTAVPGQPKIVYGKTAQAIYKSTDGGHTWQTLPHIQGNLENLVPDPQADSRLFLSLSYPCGVYLFDQQNASWSSLTPKA